MVSNLNSFSFTGNHDFPHLDLYYIYPSDSNKPSESVKLFRFLKSETFNLGTIYLNSNLKSVSPVKCIVRYNLKHSTFKDGDSAELNYQLLHPSNKQLKYRELTDFQRIDTILVDPIQLEYLVHPIYSLPNGSNFYIDVVSKGIRNQVACRIGSLCGITEITVPIL